MSLSYYQLSVPVFLRGFDILSKLLDKAVEHCNAQGIEFDELLQARLAPDMYPLLRQIQILSDAAKYGAARVAGIIPPGFADSETNLAEVRERIANTQSFLHTVTAEQYEANAGSTVVIKLPTQEMTFTQQEYLLKFALPNFYFHLTTAYDILRHKGVPIGKMDFLGGL